MKNKLFTLAIIFSIFFLSETTFAQFYYCINDHLGNTRVVVDELGNVKEYYDYYPFGKTLRSSITDQAIATYKFTGKELDDENDLDWYYFGARYYDAEIGRFLQVDRFADKYPSLTPYHYAANNPLRFIDVNGDTIYVSEAMANSEALQKYAKTKEGYNYLSQFAYEGQTIVINGQEFAFEKAGDYSHQNLKFIGSDPKYSGETIPVNSVGGLDLKYYVGVDGVQSYEIYVANNMSISHQMDTFFHEVQHAFMFASGGFRGYTGRGTPTIAAFHHGAMMQGSLWEDHANFINQANNQFNVGISVNTVWYNTLGYTLPKTIANKVRNNIKIRY